MPTRSLFVFSFLLICAILGTSFYLEIFDGFIPCALCTLQRISFAGVGIMSLLGAIFYRHRFVTIFVSFFAILFSIVGFVFAARQTWLQHFPPLNSTECGVSLQYMLNALPWHEVIGKVFTGSAECTQRSWELLTLSMAEWGVIMFACLFCIGGITLIRESKRKPSRYR